MYNQQDLDDAVAAGAIDPAAAASLRNFLDADRTAPAIDEEQFRLITGFNDIFVSIASAILLFAVGWIGQSIGQALGLTLGAPGETGPTFLAPAAVAAAACLGFVLVLQPLRREFDSDRQPSRRFRMKDFGTTLGTVTATRDLRTLSMACFAFNGLQTVFTAYFIIFLTTHGQDLAAAGAIFSLAMVVALPCRVLWGWLGSSYVSPRAMMAGLALGMAGSALLLGFGNAGWPTLLIGLVACRLPSLHELDRAPEFVEEPGPSGGLSIGP